MLYLFEQLDRGMETALSVAVPLISGIAELIGLLIIVISLLRTTWHYLRVALFHDDYDYHLEMSTGLITALEFLMAAEVSKTILLPSLDAVLLLVATFGSRALMSILLRVEMRSERAERAEAKRDEHRAGRRAEREARGFLWPWRAASFPQEEDAPGRESADDRGVLAFCENKAPVFWHRG